VPTAISIDATFYDEFWIKDERMEDISGPAVIISPEDNPQTEVNTDIARALLEAGADPNAGRDAGAPRPLHFAGGEGQLDTVRVLLASGADASAREGVFHATAAGWAECAGHAEVAALLSAQGESGTVPRARTCQNAVRR
jgi:hypothetical protein